MVELLVVTGEGISPITDRTNGHPSRCQAELPGATGDSRFSGPCRAGPPETAIGGSAKNLGF